MNLGLLRLRRARPAAALPPVPETDLSEAEQFLVSFHAENPAAGDLAARMRTVRGEVAATGTYSHTKAELAWAAKVAWRHAGRCTGRLGWRTLRLRDRRWASSARDVFAETMKHLAEVSASGRVRSVITVFAPDAPYQPGPRIANGQVLRYAAYRQPDGSVLGDPANERLTELAVSLGWQPGDGAFDILPLVVRDPQGRLHQFGIPPELVLEVPIAHPDFGWFAGLGLRWYAVPLISDMYLDAGGIRYPCAPFNGWYMAGTEVGVRDFGDEGRYNMLPAVAAGMGLDVSRADTFWKDRAAVELAVAVHHSFRAAGVMITDHHAEAARFVRFAEGEEAAGRQWCADWSWTVPPISGSTTPVFHRTYPDQVLKPGYFRHQDLVLSR
jgi:nitric-oxide synthase, bacterial